MTVLWHWLVHVSGSDYGLPYGTFSFYDFWSGVAGSFLVGLVVYLTLWWLRGTCHDSWHCLRHGKYAAAGGMFRLCRHHHPDLKGQRPHRELIDRLHREHAERAAS